MPGPESVVQVYSVSIVEAVAMGWRREDHSASIVRVMGCVAPTCLLRCVLHSLCSQHLRTMRTVHRIRHAPCLCVWLTVRKGRHTCPVLRCFVPRVQRGGHIIFVPASLMRFGLAANGFASAAWPNRRDVLMHADIRLITFWNRVEYSLILRLKKKRLCSFCLTHVVIPLYHAVRLFPNVICSLG